MIMSLQRPVTYSSPSQTNPRSPDRRYGPPPPLTGLAANVRSVLSALAQYPAGSPGPPIQISPTRSGASSSPVSGSTMSTSRSDLLIPLLTSVFPVSDSTTL